MSTGVRRVVMIVAFVGAIGAAGWSVYQAVDERTVKMTGGCEGHPIGSIRIDENGNPQICLKR